MDVAERLDGFLNELSELTKKYKLSIGGCGCCGSAWIDDEINGKCVAENLRFYNDNEKYHCDKQL